MRIGNSRRIRILLALLMGLMIVSQAMASRKTLVDVTGNIQGVTEAPSSGTSFQYIVTILMENNGLCDVTPSLVSGCSSSSLPAPYLTTLAQSYGFNTHYTGVSHPSEPNYVALLGGSTFGYSGDGYCCFQLSSSNLVDRLESAGLVWKAYAEDASGSGTCNFMPPRAGDHYPFIDFADMKTPSRCANMLTTTSPLDPEFIAALNSATLPNFVWLTPNDRDNMHSSSISIGDTYLATLVPIILSSKMFTTQSAALFIVFDEGSDSCPTGVNTDDCVVAEWIGPAVKKAYSSTVAYNHYSYLSTLEANWNLPSLTSNDASATPMTEFFGTAAPPALSASLTYSPSSPQIGQTVSFSGTASGGISPYSYSWSYGDGSTGNGVQGIHTYSIAGNYQATLTVTDSQTKTVTAAEPVVVGTALLQAGFTYTPSSPRPTDTITFTGSVRGGIPPYSYSWTFGNGDSATGASASYAYPSAAPFTVTLTINDSANHSTTSSENLTVYSPTQSDFELNANESTLNVQPGTKHSLTITVSDNAASPATIRFNATISPPGPQIFLTPANVTLSSQGSGSTSLSINITSSASPGPYWIRVNATNGSTTHSLTVQVNVAPLNLTPRAGNPCQLCLDSFAIIAIAGIAGTVTLVMVYARSRRRPREIRGDARRERGPIRVSQFVGRETEIQSSIWLPHQQEPRGSSAESAWF